MATVVIDITSDTRQMIRRHKKTADGFKKIVSRALHAAVSSGAEHVRLLLASNELGLKMQNPASGLAASLDGWMIDPSIPLGAIGVPSNSPAAAYGRMQNDGGTVYPKKAKALAVPISRQAEMHESPRDMPGLVMIKRNGRPPLLVRPLGDKSIEPHWVLVKSVTITATHWLDKGVEMAGDEISAAFEHVVNEELRG